MTDNSENRLHEVFFYGLFMDPQILQEKGVEPRNPRIAQLPNFALRVGTRGTLLRSPGKIAHGILYSLTRAELTTLYDNETFQNYKPEAVEAMIGDKTQAVLSYHLVSPPAEGESNPEYEEKLVAAKTRLGVPLS